MSMEEGAAAPIASAVLDSAYARRAVIVGAVRSLGVVGLTLAVYGLVPIRPETAWAVAMFALIGLVAVLVVFARQLARVSRSANPLIAGVEALTLVFGMFLTMSAFVYVSISAQDPLGFTQPVGKVAGIYFSVTVLATVGFGDISAVSDTARITVTVQMLVDLVLIGVAVKLLGASARRGLRSKVAAGHSVPRHGDTSDASDT
jgi:voltage-gated potassium channel